MPPPYIQTIREEILYEYAKLISRSALRMIPLNRRGDDSADNLVLACQPFCLERVLPVGTRSAH